MASGKADTRSRPGRNERRKARTRSALLAAAQHLFGEQGFDATTIAEIAEQADVAIGSFYNYFDTKEELLAALLQETLAEQLRSNGGEARRDRRSGRGDQRRPPPLRAPCAGGARVGAAAGAPGRPATA